MMAVTECQTLAMERAETKTIEIVVNGVTRSVPEAFCLDRLLVWLEVDPARVAVERNLLIVRKADWSATQITAGDRLEIVWFVGGG
jgi:thiamine biosynthesis protein ThiS